MLRDARFEQIPHEEQLRLIKIYQETGNLEARNRVVCANVKLGIKMAYRIRYKASSEDMVYPVVAGLCRAIDLYDQSYNNNFISFARWYMLFEIHNMINENVLPWSMPQTSWAKRASVYDKANKGMSLSEALESVGPLSREWINVSLQPHTSLDTNISKHHDGFRSASNLAASTDPSADEVLEGKEKRDRVAQAIDALPPLKRDIIRRRFGFLGQCETLKAIGDTMGRTKQRVDQIEKEAIAALRMKLEGIEDE